MKIEFIETGKNFELRCQGARVLGRRYKNKNYFFWRLTWRVGNKPFQRAFSEREKAITEGERIVRDLARANGEQTTLSGAEIVFVREAMRRLRPYSLTDAVEFFLKFHSVKGPSKTVGELCEEYSQHVTTKQQTHDLSKRYTEAVKYETGVWTKWAGKTQLSAMTRARVEELLAESSLGNVTKTNLVRCYRALENFAKKKSYLGQDYRSICEDISLPKKVGMPLVFTPEELMRLFIVLNKQEIAYVATMAFGGPRRAEFERMTGKHLTFDEGQARIDETIAKTKARRTLDIVPNLQEWLDLVEVKDDEFIVSKKKVAEISGNKARLAQVGLKWKNNGLRHSFCSYHLAKHRDLAKTALLAGNSAEIIKDHYNAVVSSKDAEYWFNITPTSVRSYAENKDLTELIKW